MCRDACQDIPGLLSVTVISVGSSVLRQRLVAQNSTPLPFLAQSMASNTTTNSTSIPIPASAKMYVVWDVPPPKTILDSCRILFLVFKYCYLLIHYVALNWQLCSGNNQMDNSFGRFRRCFWPSHPPHPPLSKLWNTVD